MMKLIVQWIQYLKKNKIKSINAFYPLSSYSLMLCLLLDETERPFEWFHHSRSVSGALKQLWFRGVDTGGRCVPIFIMDFALLSSCWMGIFHALG